MTVKELTDTLAKFPHELPVVLRGRTYGPDGDWDWEVVKSLEVVNTDYLHGLNKPALILDTE